MADNFVANAGSGGDTFAADDIGGVKFPRTKIALGVDGTNGGDVASANPLPAKITDGTNPAAIKAASTAAATTDASLVVALSPNSQLPARAATANPTSASNGAPVAAMADKAGRLVVTVGHARDLVGVQQTSVASTSETTIVTAGGATVFNDISQLIITTDGAAAQTITIKDATAGTTRMVLNYPNAAVAPAGPLVINFSPPIPAAAANANWTVTQSLATACNYTVVFTKNR